MALLKLTHIKAGYGKRKVLHDISLEVRKGDFVAVIGPNGSGKSTLLKVIAGLLKPEKGKIMFEGNSINHIPVHRRMSNGISYLIQGGKIFPSLTVKENMQLGNRNPNQRSDNLDSDDIPDMFPELQSLLNRRAGLLSGGERQMLALAMILVHKPRLLLLDEPSAGLSPILVQHLFEKIKMIKQRWENTIILVEQNVREALKIANSAHVLVNGQIAGNTKQPQEWLTSHALDDYFIGNINQKSEI